MMDEELPECSRRHECGQPAVTDPPTSTGYLLLDPRDLKPLRHCRTVARLPALTIWVSLIFLALSSLVKAAGRESSISRPHIFYTNSHTAQQGQPNPTFYTRPPHAERQQPTQFQLAMTQTVTAVKKGTVPDPKTRRLDGTQGTLLEAFLPEQYSEEEKAERRRKLGQAARWRFFGAHIPFLTGPTLSALNASFYRYASVEPETTVDWRDTVYITPILVQYDCASCWAMAAADTVAMATAIATEQPAIAPGVQQICDCSGMGCCQGGWPEDAFSWMVSKGNITTATNYNYWASDERNCTLNENYPTAGNISGWERVPLYSRADLMKAVNMQPVLVYISASTKDFQNYSSTAPGTSGFRVYDGNCTNEVNHAMVVVGYDFETYSTPYWILKNTWPADGWGHNGYMYIKMLDGPGKCGMMTVNPIYPVYFPNAPVQVTVQQGSTYPVLAYNNYWWIWWVAMNNPCLGIINPCGAGTCYQQNGIARCLCVAPYVEIVGVPTSKCVEPNPCTVSLFSPCGAGTCMDVGDGSYICGCPAGYAVGSRVNGAPTCVPAESITDRTHTYVTQYGDTCARIQASFNLSDSVFRALNPYANCSGLLVPGIVINLSPSAGIMCNQIYSVRPGDTCGKIAYNMDTNPNFIRWLNPATWCTNCNPTLLYTVYALSGSNTYNASSILALNPALDCSSLYLSQQVCVNATHSNFSATPLQCGQTYVTAEGDSCLSIRSLYGLNRTYFRTLNPGINCKFNGGSFYEGVQVCVAPTPTLVEINCTEWYTVQQGDTCAQIWNAAEVSHFQLIYLNPGLQCQPPFLYVGLKICIDSPSLASIADPNYLLYTVQPNDTWSFIQGQFSSKCQAFSISVGRIAEQNNATDWSSSEPVPFQTLIIPCIPKIGAMCGCVDSLPVCGADLITYNSYCDARCNFATPVTDGACSSCQMACQGLYGKKPNPLSACPTDFICPWPQWPPPTSDASAVFTTTPLCSYRTSTCQRACAIYNSVQGTTGSYCYNTCLACHRVPCSGPSELIPVGSAVCTACSDVGCDPSTRGYCVTDCGYWDTVWNPLNP